MARKQNQKKSGVQGQNNDRNKTQGRRQEERNLSENTRKKPPHDKEQDGFDNVLPSYGSFLMDMQYEDDWADEWDDDMPIEKKVAAQKAEKAKVRKKKQQDKQKPTPQSKQKEEKQPKLPKHEDEHLFDDVNDRGLMLDELESDGGKSGKSPTSKTRDKVSPSTKKKGRNDKVATKIATAPEVSQNQKSKNRPPRDEENKLKTRENAATTEPVVALQGEQAVSKGSGVSLRIDASKSVSSGSSRRRKREVKQLTNVESAAPSEKTNGKAQDRKQNSHQDRLAAKADKASTPQTTGSRRQAEEDRQTLRPQRQKSDEGHRETAQKKMPEKPTRKTVKAQNEAASNAPEIKGRTENDANVKKAAKQSEKKSQPRDKKDEAPVSNRNVPRSAGTSTPEVAAQKTAAKETSFQKKPVPKDTVSKGTPKNQEKKSGRAQRVEAEPVDLKIEVEGRNEPSGFGQLKLSKVMFASLKAANYHEPSPVQAGVIPEVLAGRDVMGQARTGTGKTAAFVIPILEGLDQCDPGDEPAALILVPTRELAVQVRDEAEKLSQGRKVRTIACYGGKPIGQQIVKLKKGVDIVVGTPGRVLDLSRRGALTLDSLIWVVLDEADRMLDIGFRPDIEKILRLTPSDRQTLLLSATLPPEVVKLAERYMRNPKVIDFSDKQMAVETIDQYYVTIDRDRKLEGLICLIKEQNPKQAIVFCRTKRGADRVKRQLEGTFKSLESLHGDMTQSVRDRVMAKFRAGNVQILVATDVVGRGIDISGISHIINYDIPQFCDDYVHRVGRTGRMGREGTAFTFVTAEEGPELTRIEMRINRQLQRAELKNFEAVSQIVPQQKETPKPVFGKPTRRVRRAL